MKAITINKDKSLAYSDVDMPVINESDVLIRVEYAGVNRADIMQRNGDYPPPPGCPEWPGLEVSGTIVEMGQIAKEESVLNIGDNVCALLGGGGYAEYVSVRYDMLLPIPDGFSFAQAAAVPEAYCTSYLNLFIEGKAKAGDTVLITAGASGLASVMIPMAKAFGLNVITTVRRDVLEDRVKTLGADRIVNTSRESLSDVLSEYQNNGCGVEVAVDCVGGKDVGECLKYLNRGARWIMIASLGGEITEVNLRTVYARGIRLIGSTLRSRSPEFKAELINSVVLDVYPKVSAGLISPIIYAEYPLNEADEAHKVMNGGLHNGKIVLKCREEND